MASSFWISTSDVIGAFGREAVAFADEVNRHRAAGEILAHRRFHLGANRRQRASGKHRVAVLLEVALDRLALILQVAGGLRQEHGVPFAALGRRRGELGAFDEFEQVAQVVREVVELHPELPLGLGPEHLVELADLPVLRIDLEELVAEQRPQLRRIADRAGPASSAP